MNEETVRGPLEHPVGRDNECEGNNVIDITSIRMGLRYLIGESVLDAYEKSICEDFKESHEYWDAVFKQSNKDLTRLTMMLSFREGSVGVCVFPAVESEAEAFFPLHDLVQNEVDDGDLKDLETLRIALTKALACINAALTPNAVLSRRRTAALG